MIKQQKNIKFEIQKINNRYWYTDTYSNCSCIVFYYDRNNTKKYHNKNKTLGWSFVNQATGDYKQLIGMDFNINDKEQNFIINAYINNQI